MHGNNRQFLTSISNGHRRCFTLVELLVVVSIIAVLAALLLPALSHARGVAMRAVCASNMKQVMLGIHIYETDYEYLLPNYLSDPDYAASGSRIDSGWQGWELMYEAGIFDRGMVVSEDVGADKAVNAIGGKSPLICPVTRWNDEDLNRRLTRTSWGRAGDVNTSRTPGWMATQSKRWYSYTSYGINMNTCDESPTSASTADNYYTARKQFEDNSKNPGREGSDERVYVLEVNMSVGEPAGKVAGGWMATEYNFYKVDYQPRYRWDAHVGRMNYACYDGHVGSINKSVRWTVTSEGPARLTNAYRAGQMDFSF